MSKCTLFTKCSNLLLRRSIGVCTTFAISFFILLAQSGFSQITISGKISDAETGEDLLFATVAMEGTSFGVTSNEYGFYSLSFDEKALAQYDKLTLTFAYLGYESTKKTIDTKESQVVDIALAPQANQLEEVVVSATQMKQRDELSSAEIGTSRLQMKAIKNLPSFGGEVDLIKVVQMLPGVTAGNQGGTGMFVRGGDADQNLVLLDEAPVYNVGHLFGFFSVFNAEAIKDITMVKGGFGANLGGRLSSIMDVRMKDGNLREFHGQGGIGVLASRLLLEGPIAKDKASFLIAGRRSYVNYTLKKLGLDIPYYFLDLNGKLNYIINKKNRIFYSFYYGKDNLSIAEKKDDKDLGIDFGFKLNNITNTLRWNHLFGDKLFSNLSLINTTFKYDIEGKIGSNNIFVGSSIFDIGAKLDFDYYKNNTNHMRFGAQVISHNFNPNVISSTRSIALVLPESTPLELSETEFAIYASSDKDFTKWLKIKYGIRLSGVHTGKDNTTYWDYEPRIAARVLITKNDALKLSFSKMKQYLHRVSSSSVSLPTDLWYPVTKNITPQTSYMASAGIQHLFESKKITAGIEVFYKDMKGLTAFREGTNVLFNNNFENELLQGTGYAHGFEFLLKKEEGKFNGWISYTGSQSFRHFHELNKGGAFPSKFSREHVISIVANYAISERWSASAVWEYFSGARFTAQIGQHIAFDPALNPTLTPLYSERNEIVLSPSHRLDLNVTLKGRTNRKFSGDLSIGVYNAYNYAQPYKIKIVKQDGKLKYTQPGLFGLIPSIAYNFKF